MEITVAPLAVFKNVPGVHVYVTAPLAVSVDEAPGQTDAGDAVIVIGEFVFTEATKNDAVAVHGPASVTVTVYVPLASALMSSVKLPFDQE